MNVTYFWSKGQQSGTGELRSEDVQDALERFARETLESQGIEDVDEVELVAISGH